MELINHLNENESDEIGFSNFSLSILKVEFPNLTKNSSNVQYYEFFFFICKKKSVFSWQKIIKIAILSLEDQLIVKFASTLIQFLVNNASNIIASYKKILLFFKELIFLEENGF